MLSGVVNLRAFQVQDAQHIAPVMAMMMQTIAVANVDSLMAAVLELVARIPKVDGTDVELDDDAAAACRTLMKLMT